MTSLRQTGALAWRSITGVARLPQAWFPALFFPLVLMAIFTGSFANAPGAIPGFPPVRSFLDFAIAGAVLQGVLIGGTTAGAAFAQDIEGGFFGRLGGSVALAMVQGLLFVGIAVIFGARIENGLPGLLAVLVIAALLAVAAGGLGIFLALRSGSAEAVQGTFPLFLILLFFSSAFFPRETMDGWFRAVADANPISYVVEGMREQIVGGAQAGSTLVAIAITAGLAVLALTGCALAFRRRVAGVS
jgi:ABC-2 type transport system permease protein